MPQLTDALVADLRAALAAEATAALRYTYYARTAGIEGHAQVAELFTALAGSAACAAHGHLDILRDAEPASGEREVGETPVNLASSVTGALEQSGQSYPRLVAAALDEGHADVASWLTALMALKKRHIVRLDAALNELARASDDLVGTTTRTGARDD